MKIDEFVRKSGFKVLAMARLSPCEYAVVLYLMNCVASGLEQIICTESDLALLTGHDEATLAAALSSLRNKKIIKSKYVDHKHDNESSLSSLSLKLQLDISQWKLNQVDDYSVQDAIVFPFSRDKKAQLEVLENESTGSKRSALEKSFSLL